MGFVWITEKQRRDNASAEERLAEALAEAISQLHRRHDSMADILERQGKINVLRPAKQKFRPGPRAKIGGLTN